MYDNYYSLQIIDFFICMYTNEMNIIFQFDYILAKMERID